MQKYWDLSERERSELTDEQVEGMIAVELMEQGVVRAERPKLREVIEIPETSKRTMYAIKAGYGNPTEAFPTIEQAEAAAKSAVAIRDEYIDGEYQFFIADNRSPKVVSVLVADAAEYANAKSASDRNKEAKKANEQMLKDYEVSLNAVTSASNGLWADLNKCRRLADANRRIIDTLNEYTEICDGDRDKAMVFLLKAYPQTAVDSALSWFSDEPFVFAEEQSPREEISI